MLSRLAIYGGRIPVAPLIRSFATTSVKSARFEGGNRFAQQGLGLRTKPGPTLRERLLGPTTGKPFIYGTYAIGGASVFGIGMLCWYGLGMSKEMSAIDRAAFWPKFVRQRLQKTYLYLAGSLGISAGAALLAVRSPVIVRLANGGIMMFVVSLAAIIGSGMLVRSIDYHANPLAKHLAWIAHTGILGVFLAPICLAGGPVLIKAATYTLALCAGLSATAICAPSEKFLNMAAPLSMGLGVVFAANIGSFFFHPSTALGASLASVVVYGGLILFSAFLLYDTQRIIRRAESMPEGGSQTFYNQFGQPVQMEARGFDPIDSQLSLYMDILNIFIRMVMIFGGGNQRRK